MIGTSFIRILLGAATALVFFYSPPLLAQQCKDRGVITSDAHVYQHPPRYVTGVGWQGNRTGFLTPGTQIYICTERRLDFGLFKKIWSQIAYRESNNWRYGWILKDNWKVWSGMNRRPGNSVLIGHVLIAMAYADDSPATKTVDANWTIPIDPPPQKDGETVSAEGNIGAIAWGDLVMLYAPFFVAMLIGMIAKTIVDYLDGWDKATLWMHLRNGVTSVLVSPIVFLGFLTAGQFSTSKQTFIVLLLLAFQNGFFWQTVLKKESRAQPSAPPGATVGDAR